MKVNRSTYIFSFAASLAVHALFFEGPVKFYFSGQFNSNKHTDPIIKNQVTLRFADSAYQPDAQPKEQSNLISDINNTASQKVKPKPNIIDKNNPYVEKRTKYNEIKTGNKNMLPGTLNKVSADKRKSKSPRAEAKEQNMPEIKHKNLIHSQKKDDKGDITAKDKVSIVKKVLAQPEKKEETAKDTKLSPEKIIPHKNTASGGNNAPEKNKAYNIDGKIDELIHNASADTESVSRVIDEIRFNLSKHNLGQYYAKIKRKISRNWSTRAFMGYSSQMFGSSALIVFKIGVDGTITGVKCLAYKGNSFFKQDCETAVIESSKLPPLPEEYINKTGKKNLWVYVNFGYNVD